MLEHAFKFSDKASGGRLHKLVDIDEMQYRYVSREGLFILCLLEEDSLKSLNLIFFDL